MSLLPVPEPKIHPESPLQDWPAILFLLRAGAHVQYRTSDHPWFTLERPRNWWIRSIEYHFRLKP